MRLRHATPARPASTPHARPRAPRPGLALVELIEAQRLLRAGRADQALPICRRLLRLDPDQANAHNLLSVALGALGRPGEGESHSRRALSLQPGDPGFLLNLAERLREQSRQDQAIAVYRQILATGSDQPGALDGLARSLAATGRFEEALEPARRAAEFAPDAADRQALYGEILAMARGPAAALEALGRAVDLDPDRLDRWRNVARIALNIGDIVWLERAAERLLRADPEDTEAKVQLANARYRQDDLAGACRILETVQAGGVHGANAQNLLGIVLARQGRVRAGLAAIDRALALAPDAVELASNGLLHANYDPESSPARLRERHEAFAARFANSLAPAAPPFRVDPDPERPLRIGYLSPDFRRHSVAYFVAPLLAEHDRAAVESVCYASVARPDAITDHLRSLASAWHDVRHLDDGALAERIRADRIDILVELAGHTLDNRLLACARRPAPVQIAYLGYPNTTGLAAIDYRITDHIADPDGFDDHHSETLIRLPRCFLSYAAPAHAPEIAPPPVLTKGHVTFGSFNNLAKINDDVVALWAAILQQVDGARLLLKASGTGDPETRRHLREAFGAHGVAPERVEIVAPEPSARDHLGLYNEVDIALDPFPYNGTTTTCEALWMGVPVITLAGDRHASRVGASLLGTIGFAAGITDSARDYVMTARLLAGQPELLAAARRSLRADLQRSALCDHRGLARAMEEAYRAIWRIWCEQVRP